MRSVYASVGFVKICETLASGRCLAAPFAFCLYSSIASFLFKSYAINDSLFVQYNAKSLVPVGGKAYGGVGAR